MISKKFKLTGIEDNLLKHNFVIEKITDLEDRPPQNNVQIDGIPETSREIWGSCEEVIKIIKCKLDITDDIEIDCFHSMGKFQGNKSKPRTVVCEFLRFKDKHKVLQNVKKLKNTGIFIFEDFSKATIELKKPFEKKFYSTDSKAK